MPKAKLNPARFSNAHWEAKAAEHTRLAIVSSSPVSRRMHAGLAERYRNYASVRRDPPCGTCGGKGWCPVEEADGVSAPKCTACKGTGRR